MAGGAGEEVVETASAFRGGGIEAGAVVADFEVGEIGVVVRGEKRDADQAGVAVTRSHRGGAPVSNSVVSGDRASAARRTMSRIATGNSWASASGRVPR